MKRTIILLILTVLPMSALDSFVIKNNNTISSYYQYSKFSDNSNHVNSGITEEFSRIEGKSNICIYNDWIGVHSTIGYYNNRSKYDVDKDTNEIWLGQDKSSIFIEKLYLQADLFHYNDYIFSVAYGVVPLTGGNFKKYTNQNTIDGNGLFTLVDLNLFGYFLVLSNDSTIYKVGQLEWTKDNFQNDQKVLDQNDGSDGIYVFYEKKLDKHLFELNYIQGDLLYNNGKLADINLYGLGYSYDDSFNTGIVYYGILGYSVWESNFLNLLNQGHLDPMTEQIKQNMAMMPDKIGFNNDTWKGYSILLGTRYSTEIFTKDISIGVEYFKTSKHWTSLNSGSLFFNDYGYESRHGSDLWTIYSDFYISRDLIISTKYQYVQNNYTSKDGAVGAVTSEPLRDNFYKTEHNLMLKLQYNF